MTITLNAEWSAQSGVILAWPHPESDWRDNLDAAEQVYCELTRHITRFEKLLIIHRDAAHRDHIRQRLARQSIASQAIIWCQAPANDSWARDFGPITVSDNGKPLLLDFTFNGWGNKYPAELDNRITRHLHDQDCLNDIPLRSLDFILEGGAIDCDGDGSLLTTTRCLLAPTRNPTLDRAGIEAVLSTELGVERVLWLEHGELSGDDTDSHVDMLARFCSHDTIAFCHCDDPEDLHFQPLRAMQLELEQMRLKDGSPYLLVPLTLPQAIFNDAGKRLPASYANFLIINGAVLVPIYDDPADNVALQRLKACFPQREIIAINCLALIQQYGSLHCVSMQLPEGVL